MRAILTSAGRGLGRPADVDWLASAARSATNSAASAARYATYSANSAAYSAARSAANSTDSTAFSAARSANSAANSAARSAGSAGSANSANSAANSALSADASMPSDWPAFSGVPIWREFKDVEHLQAAHRNFSELLSEDQHWRWWREWYLAMWHGTFSDWDFALKVAKIDWNAPKGESVWDNGAAAVAERIEALLEAREQGRGGDAPPEPLDASEVAHQFSSPKLVQVSMASLAETLNQRVDLFERAERPNEVVGIRASIEGMANAATKIAELVAKGPEADGAQTALAIENGTLRAEAERLRRELKAALDELEAFKKKPWYRASWALVSGGAVASIVTGLWVLSGDDKSLEERWSKLSVDLEFAVSKIWPNPEDQCVPELRFELPETRET